MSVFEGTIYTAGEDSFLASLIDTAGGEPITGDAASTAIAMEDLVAADPELILLGRRDLRPTITARERGGSPGMGGHDGRGRGDRVVVVTEDIVITRPGPRIVDGLEALARGIHPDAFADASPMRPEVAPGHSPVGPALTRAALVLGGGVACCSRRSSSRWPGQLADRGGRRAARFSAHRLFGLGATTWAARAGDDRDRPPPATRPRRDGGRGRSCMRRHGVPGDPPQPDGRSVHHRHGGRRELWAPRSGSWCRFSPGPGPRRRQRLAGPRAVQILAFAGGSGPCWS